MTRPAQAPDRVQSVRLSRFRGWGGNKDAVPLDADLVLVSAANGRGKSSLLEALARALGGTRVHGDGTLQTIGQDEPWSVQVATGERASGGEEGSSTWTLNPEHPVRDLDSGEHPGPETTRRATWFTQDPLGDQFERADDGDDTLLGFLAPFPPWLERFEKVLERTIGQLGALKPRHMDDTALRRVRRRRGEAIEALLPPLAALLDRAPSRGKEPGAALGELAAELPGGPSASAPRDVAWVRQLLQAVKGRLRDSPDMREHIARALERRDKAREDIQELDGLWPTDATRRLMEWFLDPTDLGNLLELLDGLASRPERWGDRNAFNLALKGLPARSREVAPRVDELRCDVQDALGDVDRARARRAREALSAWKDHWEEIEDRRRSLRVEIADADAEIARLTTEVARYEVLRLGEALLKRQQDLAAQEREAAEDARRAERWSTRQACIDALRRHRVLCQRFRDQRLDQAVKNTVTSTMNEVMKHFVVAGADTTGDIVELRQEDKVLEPGFLDGRCFLEHFSTGQKAQAALAWLLGTNALLQHWLPHRLLLLDDLSTALDLTNLAAECALLRKFAYAAAGLDRKRQSDPGRKRQVVLASHHDQLTHRIYDLLLPPGNFTMREVVLDDWTMRDGPEVTSFRIKATRPATPETRQELAEALGRLLTEESP